MKKILYLAFGLLLALACQKADNVLNINVDVTEGTGAGNLPYVASIDPANGGTLTDESDESGIQGQIEIVFSDYMAEATLTASNIVITNTTDGQDLTIEDSDLEFFPEIRKLFIYLDNVTTDKGFMIRLVSGGITNTYGKPLDFDRDNNEDGSPYDDYLSAFETGANTDTLISVAQPVIVTLDPYLELTTDQTPTILLVFSTGMDTTLVDETTVTLENEDGNAVSLNRTGFSATVFTFEPTSDLPLGQNYTVKIACADIIQKNLFCKSRTPDYIKVLDGNSDGPQELEPDTGGYFRVDTVIPPTVNVSDITGGALFTFSRLIDEATINFDNIKVLDSYGFVTGELRVYTNYTGTQTLIDYYYLRTTSGTLNAFVSKDVKDAAKDYYLDGDGNGIGGEPWDDYWASF